MTKVSSILDGLQASLDKDLETDKFELELIRVLREALSKYRRGLGAEKYNLTMEKAVTPEVSLFNDPLHEQIDEKIDLINRKIEWITS